MHPYESFVGRVEKPARYLGGEYQSVRKDLAAVDVTVALAFPDVYDVGMSHLGTKILYSLLNAHPRIACERAFAPWVDMEAELRSRQLPLLTLESARPLGAFDVVGMNPYPRVGLRPGPFGDADMIGMGMREQHRV